MLYDHRVYIDIYPLRDAFQCFLTGRMLRASVSPCILRA